MSLDQILTNAFYQEASDVHLTVGEVPVFRINGDLIKQGNQALTIQDTEEMAKQIIGEEKWISFQEKRDIDISYSIPSVSRFRVNVFYQRNSIALAIRIIATTIPSLSELGMPKLLEKLAMKQKGLILITGLTGSGKSTTLAAMLDYMNETSAKHIVTLEDPIEYLHKHKNSIIVQRELDLDVTTFAKGLRASLRQDPDVIMVGEMRDLETISTAITAAETGHLVLATLHTTNAAMTIDRIIDVFPAEQKSQIRIQLASVLEAVISQRLFPRIDEPGRVAATEILINTPAIQNLIRNEKMHQIPNVIQTSKEEQMHLMRTDVERLVRANIISPKSLETVE
mgnify:FL=1